MSSYLNNPNVTRGIRNNNPGNIIITSITWQGKVPVAKNTDGTFEQFYTIEDGVRALMRQLVNNINSGYDTVYTLIHKYSPEFENNTSAYINSVVSMIGMGINEVLDIYQETIVSLAKAIIYVENGSDSKYVTDQVYSTALANLGIDLKKKA